jgi:hypothetical protein
MIVTHTTGLSKGRAWLEELPDFCYEAATLLEAEISSVTMPIAAFHQVGVELLYHVSPSHRYGMLGAIYRPNHANTLLIQVNVAHTARSVAVNTLAPEWEEVEIGVPLNYAQAVLEGAKQTANGSLGPGILHFTCAANGAIGSSAAMFRRLGSLVVTMMAQGQNFKLADAMISFFH